MVLHEEGLGVTRGHDEAAAFIDRWLDRFEMPSPSAQSDQEFA
jgi:hypothetical protein